MVVLAIGFFLILGFAKIKPHLPRNRRKVAALLFFLLHVYLISLLWAKL